MSKAAAPKKDHQASLPRLQLTSHFSITRQALKAFLAAQTGNAYPDLPQNYAQVPKPVPRPKVRSSILRKASSGHFPQAFPMVKGCKSIIIHRNTALPGGKNATLKAAWQYGKGLESSFSAASLQQTVPRGRLSLGGQDYPSPWAEGDCNFPS